jgi:hypothetical protein
MPKCSGPGNLLDQFLAEPKMGGTPILPYSLPLTSLFLKVKNKCKQIWNHSSMQMKLRL